MRGRGRHVWLVLLAGLMAACIRGETGAAADPPLCLIVEPVVQVGCPAGAESSNAPTRTQSQAAPADTTPETAVAPSPRALVRDPEHIGVMAVPGVAPQRVRAAFARAGVEVEQAIPAIDSYFLRVDPDHQAAAVRSLRSSPVVAHATPDVVMHAFDTTPDDAEWPLQAGLRVVGFPRVWDANRGSARVTVAVVDTGVDPNQPDLRGAVVPGANFVDPAAPPTDDHGHGTAVAGIIAARSNNRQGMAGICWFCSIMPVKVLDSSGSGDDTQVAAGIVWAADHGAQVINLSLGAPGSTPELTAALAYAANRGAVVVGAAGNSGSTVPFYPAADGNVLSVAGTTTLDALYPWSNFGSWVDVAAPGCNIAPAAGGAYGGFCGTSSATPVVAGLAALAVSAQPSASVREVMQAIEASAKPLPGFVRFGRIEAPQTLTALGPAAARVTVSHVGVLTRANPSWRYPVAAGPGLLTATLGFSGRGAVELTLVSRATRAILTRISGSSPLQLDRLVAGPVTVVVRRRTGAVRFLLTVAYTGGS
jgi:subtilisin family serine protease